MQLYAQQETGVQWLMARRRGYLGDGPGQGKTPQAIVAATRLGVERPVIICPAIAREMWHRQWRTWGAPSVEPRVLSYDEAVRRRTLADLEDNDLLILDEVHRCRNVEAKRTHMALKLANRAHRVWPLSGTPMPNHVGNLYPILRAVWGDKLRALMGPLHYDRFLRRYAITVPTDYGLKVMGVKNVPELHGLLDEIMLRRMDNAELPPLRWEPFYIPRMALEGLSVEEKEAFEEGNSAAQSWGDDAPVDTTPFSTARRILGELKAVPVGNLIAEELQDGAYPKIVVLAHHRAVLNALQDRLAPFGVARVDGSTSDVARNAAIDRFQNIPECRVFLAQLQTVQETITLTAASEIALVEQSWAPDENYQAVKRIHRIGQSKPCRARLFYVCCTMDEGVERVNARKLKMRGEIIHS